MLTVLILHGRISICKGKGQRIKELNTWWFKTPIFIEAINAKPSLERSLPSKRGHGTVSQCRLDSIAKTAQYFVPFGMFHSTLTSTYLLTKLLLFCPLTYQPSPVKHIGFSRLALKTWCWTFKLLACGLNSWCASSASCKFGLLGKFSGKKFLWKLHKAKGIKFP